MAKTNAIEKERTAEDLVLIIEKQLSAPRALVYKAWSDPAHLARWFGPEGFLVQDARLDVRPGGKWYVCLKTPQGDLRRVQGVYKTIDSPSKLAFTWAWLDEKDQPQHETLVTVTFEEKAKGTFLRLDQRSFVSTDSLTAHNQGWTSTLVCLADYLVNGKE